MTITEPLPVRQRPAAHGRPGDNRMAIAALVTGVLLLGPVPLVLGAVALGRATHSRRPRRGMAIAGMVLGAASSVAAVVLALVLAGGPAAPATPTTPAQDDVVGHDVITYGHDARLDGLWDLCAAGDDAACDLLFETSPIGSEYEQFGDTCGGRGRAEGTFFCAEQSDAG